MPRKGTLKAIIIIAAVIAAFLGFRYVRGRRLAGSVDPFEGLLEGKASVGTITRTIGASGEVKAGRRDVLYIPYPVKVLEVKARPGEAVLKGGLIARYDSTSLEEDVEKAEGEYTEARAAAERAASGIVDMSMLSSLGFGSGATAGQDAASLESSYKKLLDAQGKLTYRAPFDGTLAVLEGRQGQELAATSASSPLIEVVGADSWYVLAPVSEFDINQVRLDMQVSVIVPAMDDREFTGSVSGVILEPVKSGGMVSYMVRVDIEGSSFKLKPGMGADVSIGVYEKEGALTIPHGFAYEKDGSYWVIALDEGGRPVPREVSLGEEGDDSVEVLGGLSAGEAIYQDVTPEDDGAQSGGGLFNFRARMTDER